MIGWETRKARQQRTAQLLKELENASKMVNLKETECIRVFNKPVQFTPAINQFHILRKEEQQLFEYYGESGDVNKLFTQKLQTYRSEEKRRQRILKGLESKLVAIGTANNTEALRAHPFAPRRHCKAQRNIV